LTNTRLNDIASAAIFQVREKCFKPPLSEFGHIKMRNGAMAHLKTACGPPVGHGPPVGNHWFMKTCRGQIGWRFSKQHREHVLFI